ncbi:MAG: thioesterase [Eubacteriales bacterium]|nr:thioesterase [Eubacteriales bacterium]
MPYELLSRVRFSEVGEDRMLTVPGIINYFQDCSTFQSEELGNGMELLESRGKAWILACWNLGILRRPGLAEQITVQTWPTGIKGFFAERNFRMLDAQGETLAYANTQWIYLDVKTGHPCRVDEDVMQLYREEEPLPLGKIVRKIMIPEECVEEPHFSVKYGHLDANHHVNNGQYIRMAQDYIPEGFEPCGMHVEYRNAAKLHNEIVPLVKMEQGVCTVSLCDTEKKPYAIVAFYEELPEALQLGRQGHKNE